MSAAVQDASSDFLARRGVRCIGLDRSRVSLALAVQRYGRPGTVGDNLRLPFADAAAEVVISDGVIHHTENPRAAFTRKFPHLEAGRPDVSRRV